MRAPTPTPGTTATQASVRLGAGLEEQLREVQTSLHVFYPLYIIKKKNKVFLMILNEDPYLVC